MVLTRGMIAKGMVASPPRPVTNKKRRKSHKRRPGLSIRRAYRKRVRFSSCRKLSASKCNRRNSCKTTKSGSRRMYCRKVKNKRLTGDEWANYNSLI